MSKVRNSEVVECWERNESAVNHKETFHTTGKELYSYALMIGGTTDDGAKVLKEYTASGKHGFRSQTTSCHVGLARLAADFID